MSNDTPDVSVLISDSNGSRRDGLVRLCTSAGHTATVVDTVDEAIRLVLDDPGRFALILVACSPDSFAAHKLRGLTIGHAKLVVLAEVQNDLEMLTGAYDIGATGYFEVPQMQPMALLKSLELVMLGERLFPSRFVAFQARERLDTSLNGKKGGQLSQRESEILAFVSTGESNRSIARKLEISEGTVKGHLRAITRKLGVPNRTKAAIWALEHGFSAAHYAPSPNLDQPKA